MNVAIAYILPWTFQSMDICLLFTVQHSQILKEFHGLIIINIVFNIPCTISPQNWSPMNELANKINDRVLRAKDHWLAYILIDIVHRVRASNGINCVAKSQFLQMGLKSTAAAGFYILFVFAYSKTNPGIFYECSARWRFLEHFLNRPEIRNVDEHIAYFQYCQLGVSTMGNLEKGMISFITDLLATIITIVTNSDQTRKRFVMESMRFHYTFYSRNKNIATFRTRSVVCMPGIRYSLIGMQYAWYASVKCCSM